VSAEPSAHQPLLAGTYARLSATSDAADASWRRTARLAHWLAWASVAWMMVEGLVGFAAGVNAASIALMAWALGSAIESLTSLMVVWRFSGRRTQSVTAERRAQYGVAISFWLLAPLVAALAVNDLLTDHHAQTSYVGLALMVAALLAMPVLGRTKHRIAATLGSSATAGDGTQNFVCAAQAAVVLAGLAIVPIWSAGWWVDPIIAIGIAGWSVWEGLKAWRGQSCSCC
jgi:divalent metal cation (Fe/Co/Zn/Cd) transporter